MSGEERKTKLEIGMMLILSSLVTLCICFGLNTAIKSYSIWKITPALLIFIAITSVRALI
jgi:hypothetical protein